MSQPLNYGELKLNKPLRKDTVEKLMQLPYYEPCIVKRFVENDNTIIFDDIYAYGADLTHDIELLVELLAKIGYTVNGHIWTEGTANDDWNTNVVGNVVSGYQSVDAWKTDESDEMIIEVLESRGYEVRRKS